MDAPRRARVRQARLTLVEGCCWPPIARRNRSTCTGGLSQLPFGLSTPGRVAARAGRVRVGEPRAFSDERRSADVVRVVKPASGLRDRKRRVTRGVVSSQHDGVVGRPARVKRQAHLAFKGPRPRPTDDAPRGGSGGEQLADALRQGCVLDETWSERVGGRVRGSADARRDAVDPDLQALAPGCYPPHRLRDLHCRGDAALPRLLEPDAAWLGWLPEWRRRFVGRGGQSRRRRRRQRRARRRRRRRARRRWNWGQLEAGIGRGSWRSSDRGRRRAGIP
jgi:hypothetical protein